jgi:hypothetical protein
LYGEIIILSCCEDNSDLDGDIKANIKAIMNKYFFIEINII